MFGHFVFLPPAVLNAHAGLQSLLGSYSYSYVLALNCQIFMLGLVMSFYQVESRVRAS